MKRHCVDVHSVAWGGGGGGGGSPSLILVETPPPYFWPQFLLVFAKMFLVCFVLEIKFCFLKK